MVESCAAGLPYLRSIKLDSPPGVPGLGKLLVIDVGAGSTDIGYMLRTINRETRKENLFYSSPAPTLNVAGNILTEEIKDFHYSIGKPITPIEAESFKITKTQEWIDKPFVDIWRKNISRHVKEYVINIPDKHWLDMDVTLQVIITGGSGFIEGLSEEIKKSIIEALVYRGLVNTISENIKLIDEGLLAWQFSTKEQYARMAVAIGSADKNKPSLKYLPKMDPPVHIKTGIKRY